MRGIKFITFFLIIMFATPLFGYEEELETTLPILPGDSQETVHKKLGNPTSSRPHEGYYYEYFRHNSISVYYDDNKNVKGIYVRKRSDGKQFKIFGISFGDTMEKCISLWGEPDKIEKTHDDSSSPFWTVKGFIIEIYKFDVDVYEVSSITGRRWLDWEKDEFVWMKIEKGTEK